MTVGMCDICERIDPELPNTVNAEQIGVSEATIRRHRNAAHNSQALSDRDSFFEVPEELITSRGKSIRTAYGWEKISYSPAKAAMLEARKFDDFADLIKNFTHHPEIRPRVLNPETFVVCLADFQIGKVDMNGGTEQTVQRVLDAVGRIVEKIKRDKPSEVVVMDNGDIIENYENTAKQAQTNDLPLTEQIRVARGLLTKALLMIAPHTPRLTLVSVPSNHCQVRKDREAVNFPNDDFGLDISHTIEERFNDNPALAHVRFVRPDDAFSEALTYTTYDGTKIGAVHGHQVNSPEKMNDWWKGQSHGRRNGLHEADVLVVGHFHSFRILPSGDDRYIFFAPSSDNGSSWFTNSKGDWSAPGVLTFKVQSGSWNDIQIF